MWVTGIAWLSSNFVAGAGCLPDAVQEALQESGNSRPLHILFKFQPIQKFQGASFILYYYPRKTCAPFVQAKR
jgi:hypothetical protein